MKKLPLLILLLALSCSKKNNDSAAKPNIYIEGYENNGSIFTAKYWKNSEEQLLSDGTQDAITTAIYVK